MRFRWINVNKNLVGQNLSLSFRCQLITAREAKGLTQRTSGPKRLALNNQPWLG
ncbi:MAG: hypothetical protein LBS60_13385 [Deltaproteobacteria bacterium]|nr:hypothetical protein [Deltaproteobacteria bacterium]